MAQIPLATAAALEAITTTTTYIFTIDYTDDLENGVELFDPPVGSVISNIAVEMVTTFSGNAVDYSGTGLEFITDGADSSIFVGIVLNEESPAPGDKLRVLAETNAAYAGYAPVRVHSACTLSVRSVLASGGPPTAGEFIVYVTVSEAAA